MIGTILFQTAREIREYLPGAFTYERNQYNSYMRQLERCHIQLGTFPFGGTNSNIDCMLLGMPMIAMEGNEPHERFDATMLRRIGCDNQIVHSREEYISAVLHLIENDSERISISDHLVSSADIVGAFLSEAPAALQNAFVDAVWGIYDQQIP